jgi:hypothetical protein
MGSTRCSAATTTSSLCRKGEWDMAFLHANIRMGSLRCRH